MLIQITALLGKVNHVGKKQKEKRREKRKDMKSCHFVITKTRHVVVFLNSIHINVFMNEILSYSKMLLVKRSSFQLGYFFQVFFNSEHQMDPGIYDILSRVGTYIFGFVVRSKGQVRCLKNLWKLEAFSEVSPEWDQYFGFLQNPCQIMWRTFPREGSKILRYWLVARLAFCEVPWNGF